MGLDEIISEFDRLRDEYLKDHTKGTGDVAERDALQNYSDKFTHLYAELRDHCSNVYSWRTKHDDKACTAFRARVARHLTETEDVSWNKAGEMAAASQEYEEFLEERVFYYESWDSISHLRDSIKQYIINIGQRLNNFN